jgi:hypothetical protein
MRVIAFTAADGTNLVSRGIVYTETKLRLEDRIHWDDDTFTVKHIYDTRDLQGNNRFYKCYLV